MTAPPRWGAWGLALAIATLWLADLVWLVDFETNDDLAFSWMMWGRANLPPRGDFFWFFRGGLGQALAALHQVMGPLAYTASGAALLVAAMARWYAWLLSGEAAVADGTRRACLAGVAAAVLAWALRLANFTRVAILVAYLAGSRYLAEDEACAGHPVDLGLVALAWMVRPRAALVGLALALLGRLARAPSRGALVRGLAVGAGLGLFVAVTNWLQISEIEREYLARQPYTNVLLNQRVPVPRPADPRQAMRLTAFVRWLIFDDAVFRTDQLRRMLPDPATLRGRHGEGPAARVIDTATMAATATPPWLVLVLLWLLAEQAAAGGRRRLGVALAELAVVAGGLAAVGLVAWMHLRVLEPALAAATLGLLARAVRDGPTPGRSRRAVAALVLVAAALTWVRSAQAPERARLRALAARAREEAVALEEVLAGLRVLALLDAPFTRLLDCQRPFSVRFPSQELTVIPLQGWMTQNPDYHAMIDRLAGGPGEGVAGLVADIQAHPGRYAIIGGERYVQLLLGYLRVEYGARLEVRPVEVRGLRYFDLVPVASGAPPEQSASSHRATGSAGAAASTSSRSGAAAAH